MPTIIRYGSDFEQHAKSDIPLISGSYNRGMRPYALLLLSALAAVSVADMPTLTPGMAAPKISVSGWLKYDAPAPAPGHFKVVEFWATWCGPCKTSIPHLTELAHKFKDKVDFVGVSVWEQPTTTVDDLKKFVADFGDKMDYHVAYDTPEKTMAKEWMTAAGQNGIPSAFLVNDQNQIMWVGHPMMLEKPIEDALAGKLNVEEVKAQFLKEAADAEEAAKDQKAMQSAIKQYKDGDTAGAESVWTALAAKRPQMVPSINLCRLQAYAPGSDESNKIVDSMIAGDANAQRTVASFAMSQAKKSPTISKGIADKLMEKASDPVAIYYAGIAYNNLEAYAEALKAFDSAAAKYESSKMNLNGFKEAIAKARETAVAKTGKN